MTKSERKTWLKIRKSAVNDLKKLEKKYGPVTFKSAMIFKLTVDRQKAKAEAEITRLEGELDALRRGKRLS
jgi:hypothetical protein